MEKFDFYKKADEIKHDAKDIMSGSWGFSAKQMALMLVLTLIVAGGVTCLCIFKPLWYVIAPSCFVGAFLIYVIYHGVQVFFYNLTNNLKADTSNLFDGFKRIFKLLALFISKLFMLVIGLCMLVFFGFRFELDYSMSSLVLFDDSKKTASACLKGSKRLMKGNRIRLLKLRLKSIGWILLCLTVVGALWALPYLMVEKAVFYNNLKTDF